MDEYDVLIVGGGAAGLSAALVLTRARRRVAVVDAGQPRNAPAAHMHGFLGTDGLAPSSLLARGRDEIAGYGGVLVSGTVTGVEALSDAVTDAVPDAVPGGGARFAVALDDGASLRGRRLLVTTGLRDELPDVPGVRERWGRDLLHCPYCHGFEVRDEPLGVLGMPGAIPEAVAHALLIRQWSDDVLYFAHGSPPSAEQREQLDARAVLVVDEPVTRLVVEDDRLTGLELASGDVVARTAVFVRPGLVPHDTLLTGLGCATHDSGWVIVDATGRTGVPGVWAAGNSVNPRAQVITAAGEGSAAAIDINHDLVEEETSSAVRVLRGGGRVEV